MPQRGLAAKHGVERTPYRPLFKAPDLLDERLERPLVGVVDTWKRANRCGALASTVVGLVVYAIDKLKLVPISATLFGGSDPVVPGMLFSLVAFLIATYLTPPPSKRAIQLFWS